MSELNQRPADDEQLPAADSMPETPPPAPADEQPAFYRPAETANAERDETIQDHHEFVLPAHTGADQDPGDAGGTFYLPTDSPALEQMQDGGYSDGQSADDPHDPVMQGNDADKQPNVSVPDQPGGEPAESNDTNTDADRDADDVAIICDRDPSIAEPVDAATEQELAAYRQQLTDGGKVRPAHEPGPAYDYQREWCGDTEYRITPDGDLPKAAWADGLNDKLALAQDAKYIKVDSDSSWFIPDTLHPAMAGLAERKMDDRLIKYRDAIESPDNPLRGLEIIVNRPEAGQFIAGRMNALGIPGIVRLRH